MDYLFSYKYSESPQPQWLGITAKRCNNPQLCGRRNIMSDKRHLVHYIEFLGVCGLIDLCNRHLGNIQIF